MRPFPTVLAALPALLARVVLGAVAVSPTPGFANTTVSVLKRPDDGFLPGPTWTLFLDAAIFPHQVGMARLQPSGSTRASVRGPTRHRTDDLSDEDVFGYDIDLSEAWNEKALPRFLGTLESTSRLGFGQVLTSAGGRMNASASMETAVELRRDEVLDLNLEAAALYFEGGSRNDTHYESEWFRGLTSAKVFPWRLGEDERLGLGVRSTARYNTPTGTERDVWVHVGPVLKLRSGDVTVELLLGYYTSYEELDDDIPQQLTGLKRDRLDFDVEASGLSSHVEIVKRCAWGAHLSLQAGAQLHSDRVRQAGGRASVRLPLTALLERGTIDARTAWSRVSIQIGVEGRYFDLGSRHMLPFREDIGGTFNMVYELR